MKGGRLLQRMVPARVLTLVISDVIGDDLSSIGSGPTALDPSKFRDALDVLARYGVDAPENVVRHLKGGVAGAVAETPKPGDAVLDYVEHRLLASNSTSLAAAVDKARELGFTDRGVRARHGGRRARSSSRVRESAACRARPAC